jgi:anaerobic magnesium-protoporphyrin IX monomethyl ester cyclase
MLGFPTETRGEILDTINFARRSKLHMASFFIPNPFKGTELFEMLKKLERDIDFDYSNYDYNTIFPNISRFSSLELNKLHRRAYLSFYFKPKRLWYLLLGLPKKKQLFKYVLQFWRRVK